MNTHPPVSHSAIYSEQAVGKILNGLEGKDLECVELLVNKIKEAGIQGDISAVSMARDTLGSLMKVLHGDRWPKWAFSLHQFIRQLEDRMRESGIPEIQRNVLAPLAAIPATGFSFYRGTRTADSRELGQAAEAREPGGMDGARVAGTDDMLSLHRY